MAGGKFPSIEETLKHPAYPGANWNLEPDEKGLLPCAKGRGGPIDIYWERHGTGPRKLLLVMGLAGMYTSWQRQTKYFGHDLGETYSVLLIDNRGIGNSGAPLQRYSSSQMALDILEVLEHVGWTAPRQIHLVGISLGGMISQEIAHRIPERIASLLLLSTTATMDTTANLPSVLRERLGMLVPKPLGEAIEDTARTIFGEEWLAAPDEAAELPVPDVTPKCGPPEGARSSGEEYEYLRFETNFQRFQAQELVKRLDTQRFTTKGFLLQLVAAAWHYKSPEQLKDMADKIGRDRITVAHGTRDGMIDVKFGRRLIEYIQPSVGLIIEGMGHAAPMEDVEWLKKLLTERIDLAEEANKTSAPQ